MKRSLITLCLTFFCFVSHSDAQAPLPPGAAHLLAKFRMWTNEEQKALESRAEVKRLAVIESLQALKKAATKNGNLNGAIAIEDEITRLKAQPLKTALLVEMQGEWEWDTGAKGEFGPEGKNPDGQQVLWVIDPEERLFHLRANSDWYYDIKLSADGDSFTATRIQTGKKYSSKRASN